VGRKVRGRKVLLKASAVKNHPNDDARRKSDDYRKTKLPNKASAHKRRRRDGAEPGLTAKSADFDRWPSPLLGTTLIIPANAGI